MSRFVDRLHIFDRRSSATMADSDDVARDGLLHHHHHRRYQSGRVGQSLGELLKTAGDSTGDDEAESLEHFTIDLSGAGARQPSFVLTFTDLTYTVKNPAARRWRSGAAAAAPKVLLDSISGEARDGEILAVLGASGSGKSTLIDALAGRISTESLGGGSVELNAEPLSGNLLKTISAYVMQDDLLYPMLTVEETLTYAAEFRLPRSLPASRKKARVQALIDQLGLRRASGTIIGDEGHRGVSGGERRRVSIGTDIVHDPIVLFLDEPTSGLDSTSAFMVVKVLQRIARSGSVVIMSVHQPSARIVGLLDRLIFLSHGQTVYAGPPEGLQLFFSEFGRPIPENENRTEFALDLVRELEGASPSGAKPLVEFNKSWQGMKSAAPAAICSGYATLNDAIAASISRGKLVSGSTDGPTSSAPTSAAGVPRFANPFWVELLVLMRRSATNSRRMPELFLIRLAAILLTGFIYATIFWRLDDTPKGVQERLGFFAIGMSTMFYTCADALPVFLQERYIYLRETAYNAYRRSSYVLSNAIVGMPALLLLSITFAATTFFAVGLSGGLSGFSFFFLVILASFWAGNSFVTFLSGVVTHVMLGYVVVVAILAYFLLFSGFFINRDRIPDYWIWFHYLSLVKYPYEAVMQNEFDVPGKCFARGTQMFDNSPIGALPAEVQAKVLKAMGGALGFDISGETCITTGADILEQQAVTQLSKWNCLLVTVAWGFLFRVLFYFALLLGGKNKRR